jgi:phage terminase small subunit
MEHISSRQLSPKQTRFIQEYLVDLNATQAAMRSGYSPRAAYAIGVENLKKPQIRAELQKAQALQLSNAEVSAKRVLQEAARLAFVDVRKLYAADGTLLPLSAWDDDTAAAVASLEVIDQFDYIDGEKVPTGKLKKVRLWSKPEQLTLLAKHLRLLQDDTSKETTVNIQVNIHTSLSEALTRAYDRQLPQSLPDGSRLTG